LVEPMDIALALAMLGLPMAVLSWLLFSWMVDSGDIDLQDSHEAINQKLKQLRKLDKKPRKGPAGRKKILFDKWMWFGSGFYGLAGFWTLLVIEINEVMSLIMHPVLDQASPQRGIIDWIISFLLDQLGNVIQAFLWFGYWPADSVIAWVLVAYLGYWLGVELARHQKVMTPAQLYRRFFPHHSGNE